jgi:NAD+ synthase
VAMTSSFSAEALKIDAGQVAAELESAIRDIVSTVLRRKGVVLGLSGGVDSSVTAALCQRALGPDRVIGLLMPEAESSPDSLQLGRLMADSLGIRRFVEDITAVLAGTACYARRDEAIRSVMPEYGDGHKCKIVMSDLVQSAGYPVFFVVAQSPEGVEKRARLSAQACLAVVAATNFKQRTRKMIEYYYADRFHLAVAGTPNRLEYDQGFFVKNGDGSADLKPIAHLYKSQVYQLAAHLRIPPEIYTRPPTTDTYPLEQSQEEFYFSLSLEKTDLCLYGRNHSIPASEVAEATGLTPDQVKRVYALIDSKRAATRYLHLPPVLIENVSEIKVT